MIHVSQLEQMASERPADVEQRLAPYRQLRSGGLAQGERRAFCMAEIEKADLRTEKREHIPSLDAEYLDRSTDTETRLSAGPERARKYSQGEHHYEPLLAPGVHFHWP